MKETKERKKRMTCQSYCDLWNSEDKDCEAMGENHLSPRTCPIYKWKHKNEVEE